MQTWAFDHCEWHQEREAFREQLLCLSSVVETLTSHWRKCNLRETNEQLSETAQVIYCWNLHFLLVTYVTLPRTYSWRVTFEYISFSVHWLDGWAESIKSYNAPRTTPCESDDIRKSSSKDMSPGLSCAHFWMLQFCCMCRGIRLKVKLKRWFHYRGCCWPSGTMSCSILAV